MFSRGKSVAARPAKTDLPGLSFIGPEVLINGNLTTSAQIHVDGRVEGDVTCDILCQGETGTIAGNISAAQARIAGLVDGTVTADTVVLESSARVTGDVTYETISIAAGAKIEGRLARKQALTQPIKDSAPKLVAPPVDTGKHETPGDELFLSTSEPKAAAAG